MKSVFFTYRYSKILLTASIILLVIAYPSMACADCIKFKNIGDVSDHVLLKVKCIPSYNQFRELKYHGINFQIKLKYVPTFEQLRTIRFFQSKLKLVLPSVPSDRDLRNLKYFDIYPIFKLKAPPSRDDIKRLKFYGHEIKAITVPI